MANTAWNPSDATAGITFSSTNHVVTATGANLCGRAADRQASGKFYWEVTANTFANSSSGVGFAMQGAAMAAAFVTGNGPLGCLLTRAGTLYVNGVSVGLSFGTIAAATVICFALDLDNRGLYVRLGAAGNYNLQASANPATFSDAIDISSLCDPGISPVYPCFTLGATSEQLTANFGDSAFTGAVPSGYTSGFTSGASIPTSVLESGLVRETLYAASLNEIHASGLVREVLRTTGTGGATFIAVDGLVREVLRTAASPTLGGSKAIAIVMG